MASIKIYLDTRKSKGGNGNLTIKIFHNKVTSYMSLGISLAPQFWDDTTQQVVKHPQRSAYNTVIRTKLMEVDNVVADLLRQGKLGSVTAKDIKAMLMPKEETKDARGTFVKNFQKFISYKQGRTKDLYEGTLKRLYDYDSSLDSLSFEDITKDWLLGFDRFLQPTSKSVNGRNIHFRNIRAVFNDAIDDDVTTFYPFRKFKIKNEETAKRALTVEQLRGFFNATLQPYQEKWMDVFKLSFMLIGINMIDLCNLTEIVDGRIIYHRAKTGRLYSIKVEPEIQELIDKYRGADRLLNFLDGTDVHGFTRRCNEALQKVGDMRRAPGRGGKQIIMPMFPDITTYVARHSYASIAANDLDAPYDIISKALGHKSTTGASVTSVYVDYDMKKVDRLNRAMIDWVFYGKKTKL